MFESVLFQNFIDMDLHKDKLCKFHKNKRVDFFLMYMKANNVKMQNL